MSSRRATISITFSFLGETTCPLVILFYVIGGHFLHPGILAILLDFQLSEHDIYFSLPLSWLWGNFGSNAQGVGARKGPGFQDAVTRVTPFLGP